MDGSSITRKFGHNPALKGYGMGDLISLIDRRRELAGASHRRPATRAPRATFAFDLALPGTYLAAERVDQVFEGVRWQPVLAPQPPVDMGHAEERADALGIPLIWPEPYPSDVRPAMRVAALAAEMGRAAAFTLAATRLAFCGGFDLGDPEVLAEAAAAASIPLDFCLAAARDASRDEPMERAGRRLLEAGADQLPVLRVGRRMFAGEHRLPEAIASASAAEVARFNRPA